MKDKWIKFSFEDDEYYYVKASKIAAIRGKEGGVSTVLFGKEFDSLIVYEPLESVVKKLIDSE